MKHLTERENNAKRSRFPNI